MAILGRHGVADVVEADGIGFDVFQTQTDDPLEVIPVTWPDEAGAVAEVLVAVGDARVTALFSHNAPVEHGGLLDEQRLVLEGAPLRVEFHADAVAVAKLHELARHLDLFVLRLQAESLVEVGSHPIAAACGQCFDHLLRMLVSEVVEAHGRAGPTPEDQRLMIAGDDYRFRQSLQVDSRCLAALRSRRVSHGLLRSYCLPP